MALSEDERDAAKLQTAIENDDGYRITLENLMTDLTGVDIRALLEKDDDGLRASLEAMLPKPTYPEHMFGRWAQHPTYGYVLVIHDRPDEDGKVSVAWQHIDRANGWLVPVSELTFPDHSRAPEYVKTEEEYDSLPAGSIVAHQDGHPLTKANDIIWYVTGYNDGIDIHQVKGVRRRVLRRGWGNG